MRLIFGILFLIAGIVLWVVQRRVKARAAATQTNSTAGALLRRTTENVAQAMFWAGVGGAALGALLLVTSAVRTISTGYVGVVTFFGKVQPVVLHEGINLINPLLDVTQMTTQVQKHTEKYDAGSRDMQAVHVQMVVNYRLKPDRAAEIYQRVGTGYASIIIDPAAQEVLKASTALHIAPEILQKRQVLKDEVQKSLTAWLEKYGIEVKEVSLANVSFDKAYEKAIENKQLEEQKAEQKKYELIQAQRGAEIVAADAKGKGDAAEAMARGTAAALRIQGAAEADYNQKVAASLTPTLIQKLYLDKWDGALSYLNAGSGGQGFLLNLQAPEGRKKAEAEK